MKVLITGAGGQLGQALLASVPEDIEALAAARRDLDVTNARHVEEYIEAHCPELIVNTAAWTAVDKAESDPDGARLVNHDGARNLAAAAAAKDIRMIQLSTDFVFDGSQPVPFSPADSPGPVNVYGATKLDGERAVRSQLPDAAIVLRSSWVYGTQGSNFLLTMLRLLREASPVRVVVDQVGTPTSTASLARAVWAFAASSTLSGTFHWTDAGVASWYDFADAIAAEGAASGHLPARRHPVPIYSEEFPTAARRPRYSVLDTRATTEAIGLVPQHWRLELAETMRQC